MNRPEAVATLKEMLTQELVQPSSVSLETNKDGSFSIVLSNHCNPDLIRAFLADKNLILDVDSQSGKCKIYEL